MTSSAQGANTLLRANRASPRIRLLWILATLALLPGNAGSPSSESGSSLEYQIKAAFIYNFTSFVEWPEEGSPQAPRALTIAVLGKDPFGTALAHAIKDKTANGKSLLLKSFPRIEDLGPCDLLFISRDLLGQLDRIQRRIEGQHVLTVAEEHPQVSNDVVITLLIQDNKVRFEIDLDAADVAGLTISSKLLSLAQVVRGNRTHQE